MKNSYLNDEFFSRLETLALNLKTNLAGFFGGTHRTNTYGQTVEFADYREYMLGDDIRRIDWNLYSRFEKYFLKLFTDERQMHTQIFLDCSASMGKDNPEKASYAMAIVAAIGFLSVHSMDKLSIKLIKNNVAEDSFGTIVGKSTFFRAISQLENIEFVDEADITQAITNTANLGSNDGLTVIVSDFFGDTGWKKAVDYLCYKKRQVALVQIMTLDEMSPVYSGRMNLIDAESGSLLDDRNMRLRITNGMLLAYEEALKDFVEDIRSFCVSRGAEFLSVTTDKSIEKVIFEELLKTGVVS